MNTRILKPKGRGPRAFASGIVCPVQVDSTLLYGDGRRGEGIRVGTAIGLLVRKAPEKDGSSVVFREFWGTRKREELPESLQDEAFDSRYALATPTAENRLSFYPHEVSAIYREWPKIVELCAEPPSNGLMEKRGGNLIDIDRDALEAKMRLYHAKEDSEGKELDWESYRLASSVLTNSWAGFDPKKMRARAVDEGFHSANVVRYAVRPFDTRWCYYSSIPSIWNRCRPPLWEQCFDGNVFLLSRMRSSASPEGFPISYTRHLSDDHYFIPDGVAVPFALKHAPAKQGAQGSLDGLFEQEHISGNLSDLAVRFLRSIQLESSRENAAALWFHTLAIGYSTKYVVENADGIRGDWPRIPLPASHERFQNSVALGRQVAGLLDTEQAVPGVTAGVLRAELRSIAALTRTDGKPLEPGEDFAVTASWGHINKTGAIMPGQGRLVRRERTQKEHGEIVQGITALGMNEEAAMVSLGSAVVDVYLNDRCAWTGIPENVWELFIGGYQPIKKWLSYREHGILRRALTLAEVEEVQAMARRLTALCLLQPHLDANYEAVKANTWKQATAEGAFTEAGA